MAEFIRYEHTEYYTVISNALLQDKNLSLKAKGLGAYMYSLPDDWEFSINGIVANCGHDKRDSVKRALKELEENGYLKRTHGLRNKGRFTNGSWTITDDPYYHPAASFPPTVNQPEQSTKGNKVTNNASQGEEIISDHQPYSANGVDVYMDDLEKELLW